MNPQTDLYEVLGVPRDALATEIREAFRRIASETHPDKTGNDPRNVERFRAATAAYKVLGDQNSRRIYDRGQVPPNSIQEFFATNEAALHVLGIQLPTAPAAPQHGVWLTAKAAKTEKTLAVQTELTRPGREEPLSVNLNLPEDDKRWCRLANLGGEGRNGAENGDLWVFIID